MSHKGISERFWREIKKCAEKRGIEFSITPKEAWSIFMKQEGQCAYTGKLLDFMTYGYRGTASLDRIDSRGPYRIDNVQWTTGPINIMKGGNESRFFIEMCCQVADCYRESQPIDARN